jgi:glycosyltransferase involved in cell wall biosynthesis
MADCARSSALCRDWPIHRIPNPLNLERWKPLPKDQARSLLGLPERQKILLFGAIGGERDRRKGGDLLRSALHELKRLGAEIHLAVFGQSGPAHYEPFPFPVTYLGRLQDDLSMILAYNAADVMLVPSRQDNLPQTAVEAQACGIPVVAFDVGGLSDIVEDGRTGYLVRPFDGAGFARNVAELLQDGGKREGMSLAAREAALKKFAAPLIARAYAEIYAQVLAGSVDTGRKAV